MEENNQKVKVKLTTIIVLAILIVIIVGIVIGISNNNDSKNNINTEQEKTAQNENTQKDIEKENEDSDLNFKFLKMENKKENIVYSPLSIKYALNMLNDGANGKTKTQIENVIRENLTKYDNIDNILSLANALYIRDTYSQYVKDEYKNNLTNKYNAEIKYDAFKDANNINQWIENKTFKQIKNMLLDDQVANPDNEMILINALAIDMEWKIKFDAQYTYGEAFYLENGNIMQTTMMNRETRTDDISYYKDDNITALAMDLKEYNDTQMDFIAIMPNNNLSNYVEDFSTDKLNSIINNLTPASKTSYGLDISIPRFSFDYKLNLKEDLKNMGITDAFDENLADFSNMSNRTEERNLYVSDALHKANIDFSEKGLKASAATVIIIQDAMTAIGDVNRPIEVKIDKPFVYVIRDKKTNEIWFVGTVYEPNSWEKDKKDYQYR